MKRNLSVIAFFSLVLLLSSCKSRKASCEAYSQVDHKMEQSKAK